MDRSRKQPGEATDYTEQAQHIYRDSLLSDVEDVSRHHSASERFKGRPFAPLAEQRLTPSVVSGLKLVASRGYRLLLDDYAFALQKASKEVARRKQCLQNLQTSQDVDLKKRYAALPLSPLLLRENK